MSPSGPVVSDDIARFANNLPQVIWICDAQGRLIFVNAAWTRYTGLSLQETQSGDRQTVHPDDREPLRLWWTDLLAQHRSSQIEVRVFEASSQAFRWCHVSVQPKLSLQGELAGWYGITTDIHDQKILGEEIQRSLLNEGLHRDEYVREQEANTVLSHEVRTPLQSMISLLDAMTLTPLSAEQHQIVHDVQLLAREVVQAAQATIDWSSSHFSNRRLDNSKACSPEELLGEIMASYSSLLSKIGVTVLRRERLPSSLSLSLDTSKMRIVFSNIVSNFLKYGKNRKNELGLSWIPTSRTLWIEVTSTEVGDSVRAQNLYRSSGFGLEIVRRSVSDLGGTLRIRQQGEASFSLSIQIPADLVADPTVLRVPNSPKDVGTRPLLKILLVEDNALNRQVATELLRARRHDVYAVSSVDEALVALRERTFDSVVVDLELGLRSGIDLLFTVQQELPSLCLRTQFVAFTASTDPSRRAAALQAGFHGYLVKPLSIDRLESEVLAVFDAHARARALSFELQEIFKSDCQSRVAEMEAAFEQNDLDGFKREAHAFKSSCHQRPAPVLAEICQEAEALTSLGSPIAETLFGRMKTEISRVLANP